MDIDLYTPCPCQSGKKIKFCCGKDVVNELKLALTKHDAGQSVSALSLLSRTLEKSGPKNSLLTIQTHIQIATGDADGARKSNELFLKNSPGSSLGLQQKAMILAAEGHNDAAVETLQDSMDAITDNRIPMASGNAFRIVGAGLLNAGQLVAARAHFQFAQGLKKEADEGLQRMLFQTYNMPNQSMILKRDFRLEQPTENPDEFPWSKNYVNVIRTLDRGQFRKGLRILKKIDEKYPDQMMVVRGIAILNMYLGYHEDLADSFRRVSRLPESSEWDAIEFEAIAQLLSTEPLAKTLDVVRVTHKLNDYERVAEIALASPRIAAMQDLEVDPFEEGPAPRSAIYILDRDQVATPDDLTVDNAPSVIGEAFLYGKQTDREARLELLTTQNDRFDDLCKFIKSELGEYLAGDTTSAPIGSTTVVADTLSWNWHLPEGTQFEQHSKLVEEFRCKTLVEKWTKIEFTVLNNKTPEDAAKDPEMKIPLQALIMHLEQAPDAQLSATAAAKMLRDHLGLSDLPSIDEKEQLSIYNLSPVQQQYLDFKELDDEQILNLQSQAMAINNISALRQIVPQVLDRPQLSEKVPRDVSYGVMAQLVDDSDETLEYLQKAKQAAKDANRPIGVYLVQEFEFRLSRGMTEKLEGLLQRIQRNHISEPNVEYQMARVLQRFGFISPDGRPTAPAQAIENEAADSGGIWTPEAESDTGADSDEPSKLWIPGSD